MRCPAQLTPGWFSGGFKCCIHCVLRAGYLSVDITRETPLRQSEADLIASCICQTERQELREVHTSPSGPSLGVLRECAPRPPACACPPRPTGELAPERRSPQHHKGLARVFLTVTSEVSPSLLRFAGGKPEAQRGGTEPQVGGPGGCRHAGRANWYTVSKGQATMLGNLTKGPAGVPAQENREAWSVTPLWNGLF